VSDSGDCRARWVILAPAVPPWPSVGASVSFDLIPGNVLSEIIESNFLEYAHLLIKAHQAERSSADKVCLVYSLTKWVYQGKAVLLQVLQAASQTQGIQKHPSCLNFSCCLAGKL